MSRFGVWIETNTMKIVLIDDYIGKWYVDEDYIVRQLTGLEADEEIEVKISSPGGEVYTGIAIFNRLRELARTHSITVRITALCASMASYIALAPRTVNNQAKVIVSENSIFMIHNPSTYSFGDYRELRKESDILDKLSIMFASTFAFISNKSEKEIRKLMDAETWYFGSEVVDSGFANFFEAINVNEGMQIESAEVRKIKAQSEIMSAQEKCRAHYEKDALEKAVAVFDENFFSKNILGNSPSFNHSEH
jgi:ATP-dependent protease ClpP protease subunit